MTKNLLGEIVARKREDVTARLAGVALDSLRGRAERTERSLAAALERPGARFVMEVKRSSPSAGALRPDVDPAALALAYRGAADAISVLTDTPYFGGSLDDLAAVRAAFDGPVLAKDFIVDVRQVVEARIHGADAVLAMLSVLGDEQAGEVSREAERLGMDVLVEAHDEEEVRRAVALGARLIGINNRNLKTMEVDLGVTEELAGLVPADRILISESGIGDRSDVERLAPFADAFLVGSSLMRADDPASAARALAFGRVKICGITAPEDVAMVRASGAFYAGLVMVPGTPRAVSGEKARAVARAADEQGVPLVGVFRNEKVYRVALEARRLRLAAVQLHGEEDAGYVKALKALLPPGVELWTCAAMGGSAPSRRGGSHRTLFDSSVGGSSGGTGQIFDWSQVEGRDDLGDGLLAGGLNPGNAAQASRVGAYALDVSSGVEASPGRKDPAKVRAFFEALRLPARGERRSC